MASIDSQDSTESPPARESDEKLPSWLHDLRGRWPTPQQGRKALTRWLLVHRVGGPAFSYDVRILVPRLLQYWGEMVAYGYLVDRDGWVFMLADDHIVTPHAWRHNEDSIGVGFVGDFRQEEPTGPQIAGGAQLFTWLLRRHPHATIDGHTNLIGATQNTSKECPGRFFPLDTFRAARITTAAHSAPYSCRPSPSGKIE